MNRTLIFFVALLLLFCGASILWIAAKNAPQPGSVSEADPDYVAPADQLTEFEFKDQLAKPFSSKQLKGKIWMGSFFFADCPTICREQNTEIAKLSRRFAEDDVTILNITVAPDKDPPHKLLIYANGFGANHEKWKFLTGRDLDYVVQVGTDIFGLPSAHETHTSEVVLFDRDGQIVRVDRDGQMQASFNVNEPEEFTDLVNAVEELLAANDSATESDNGPEGMEAVVAPVSEES